MLAVVSAFPEVVATFGGVVVVIGCRLVVVVVDRRMIDPLVVVGHRLVVVVVVRRVIDPLMVVDCTRDRP